MTDGWVCPNCGGPGVEPQGEEVKGSQGGKAYDSGTITRLDERYTLGRCQASKPCSKGDVPLIRRSEWDRRQGSIRAAQVADRKRTLLKGLHKGTIKPGDAKYAEAVAAYKEVNGER